MTMKPIIGISSNRRKIDEKERFVLNQSYVNAVRLAGGIPFILPFLNEEADIEEQVKHIDGLLLSGGQDVWPHHYGEEPEKGLGIVHIERDAYEMKLIKKAYQHNKPILGVCRGMQLLNVVFGGTLHQDVLQIPEYRMQHNQQTSDYEAFHTVQIEPNTKLYAILDKESLLTNTFHHQAVKDIAPTFIANAFSKDGLIEGVEKVDHPFILGVQWHPETMVEKHPAMQKLFKAFVNISISN